jgi:hypothetical protein
MLLGQLGCRSRCCGCWPWAGSQALYRRATGQTLSVRSGAHLGWISGIFGFLLRRSAGGLRGDDVGCVGFLGDARSVEARGMPEAAVNQVIDLFRSPRGFSRTVVVVPVVTGAAGVRRSAGREVIQRGAQAAASSAAEKTPVARRRGRI